MLQGTVTATTATADAGTGRPDLPQAERPVPGADAPKAKPRTVEKGPRTPREAPKTSWPKPGAATVKIPDAATGRSSATKPAKAKGLPIEIASPGSLRAAGPAAKTKPADSAVSGPVKARVLSRKATAKAGVRGLLFTLDPEEDQQASKASPRSAGVRVDYSSFSQAYGGGYASRLSLVEFPACVLTTPGKSGCSDSRPVRTVNDTEKQTLTADSLKLRASGATVLAAVAEEEGGKGDYKATKLAPSATWKTNLNTGDFSWAYDMPAPEVPGGLKPSVGLSYSSAQIDGRTGGSNNQSSWAGDGFDLWTGFIERKYRPCSDDGIEHDDGGKPADQCWKYDNAFLSFNGKAGELIPVGDDEWKLQRDDGTRIKRLASSERHNGDDNGEYWRLTDPEGTRYYFGYHRLPGWSEGDETTGSAWTAPVFGDDSGEPCHASTFKDSWCQQGWRWNLDYAVDTHGNAVAYYYDQEKNSYGRNLKEDDDTRYVRGGSVDRIEYGLKSSSVYDTEPLAKVDFTSTERCIAKEGVTCAADTIDDKAQYWYDTPWDLNCDAGKKCDQGRFSPSFWTRKRLTGVTSYVRDGTAYEKVDSWKLRHRWGTADVDYQLLLDSIQHTGHSADPAITLPKTTFAYTQLENRLDKTGDGYAPFIKARLSTVADEYGGQTDVNYSAPACKAADLPTPETNTTRCFPQYIGGSSSDDADREWFNKYVVTSVTSTDRTGGAPDQVARYSYLGGAAWHYDESGLVKNKERTWSEWRGYGHVREQTGGQGGSAEMKSQEDSYFLRGMHGDRENKDGGSKDVSVTLGSGEGDPITDHRSASGFTYKIATYSAPGGKILSKMVDRPWHHETASKKHSWGTLKGYFADTGHSKTWTSLDKGAGDSWRVVSQSNTYDTVAGRLVKVDDYGDNSTGGDNRCTRTTFATNTAMNILGLPSREETLAVKCDATPDRAEDVITDTRTAYDGAAYGAAPAKGDATATAVLEKHDGTTARYLESDATFDGYGRQLTATDLTADVTVTGSGTPARDERDDGRTTTTAYSP
ncbi:sugar-binding protein, partial [Streptomyces sp. N2-109]|nr:sugar-binding protein [Streptomyces gossypii]